MRKFLKPYADFTFISAPHALRDEQGKERSWWFTKTESFSSKDECDEDTGFGESLDLIVNTFRESGPFDGLLGFSQGAALTAMICALKQRNELQIDFKFAVIVSGFKSKCSKHFNLYTERIRVPSLHIIGDTDNVIDKCLSEALAEVFVDPIIMRHAGGHHVPTSNVLKESYRDFFSKQVKQCLNL